MSSIRGDAAAAERGGHGEGEEACCEHAHGDCGADGRQDRDAGDPGATGCACCGGEDADDETIWNAPFIVGIVLFVLGFVFEHFGGSIAETLFPGAVAPPALLRWGPAVALLVAYLFIGRNVLLTAGKNILRGRVFDENFLMTIASVGAFVIGEYPEAVAVMLFYEIGEFFQGMAVRHSRKSIASLLDIRPDTANILVDGEIREIPAERVAVGDVVLLRPGDKAPLDGVVVSGGSSLDMKALTGESLPVDVGEGDRVLSGSIN
ncbi:MAG: hypothetical protein LBL63_06600, partial [Clostridiales Family XIII bacterium]|nr:hypothetical protein [Clostridiales Family XIII bacterium]